MNEGTSLFRGWAVMRGDKIVLDGRSPIIVKDRSLVNLYAWENESWQFVEVVSAKPRPRRRAKRNRR